mmetsp:Transcript_82353/g.254552  ORF Transcript_82353/g.254552 Transcript_82353/m.254552 type:complete len:200 (+) Transcript_82353:304-903(+)
MALKPAPGVAGAEGEGVIGLQGLQLLSQASSALLLEARARVPAELHHVQPPRNLRLDAKLTELEGRVEKPLAQAQERWVGLGLAHLLQHQVCILRGVPVGKEVAMHQHHVSHLVVGDVALLELPEAPLPRAPVAHRHVIEDLLVERFLDLLHLFGGQHLPRLRLSRLVFGRPADRSVANLLRVVRRVVIWPLRPDGDVP